MVFRWVPGVWRFPICGCRLVVGQLDNPIGGGVVNKHAGAQKLGANWYLCVGGDLGLEIGTCGASHRQLTGKPGGPLTAGELRLQGVFRCDILTRNAIVPVPVGYERY